MVEQLKHFGKLEYLYLDGSEVREVALGQLKGLKKLRSLESRLLQRHYRSEPDHDRRSSRP